MSPDFVFGAAIGSLCTCLGVMTGAITANYWRRKRAAPLIPQATKYGSNKAYWQALTSNKDGAA